MKNKKNKKPQAAPEVVLPLAKRPNDFLYNRRFQLIVLMVISMGFYFNTIVNEYALDDMIVITSNTFTKQGFAGIKNIMFKDSFVGYTGMENQLAGGRYRPLSIASFAVEVGLFGQSPHISHFFNIILYGILTLQLFLFLEKFVFPRSSITAFIATLLFTIHPIHTEVVANIKSRDEIMCFSFVLLSMHLWFTHLLEKKSTIYVALAMFFYFLSLLSKESSLIYIAVVPMIMYYFHKRTIPQSIRAGIPYIAVVVFYFIVRVKLTGFKMVENGEILNNYYMLATKSQKFATKIYLMGKYLIMLIWPYPMSYDYSYNQIKYVNPGDGRFVLAMLVNIALLIYSIVKIPSRSVLSFCILFYFMNMSLVCNFFFDVGTPMADRFLFYPSLSLAIIIAYYGVKFIEKENVEKRLWVGKGLLLVFLLVCGKVVIARNMDWRDENHLFPADVDVCPNSAKTNSNCGVAYINISATLPPKGRDSILNLAIQRLDKSVGIHPGYVDAWINMGVAYSRLNNVEKTDYAWNRVKQLSPSHPKLINELLPALAGMWFNKGFTANQEKKYDLAVMCIQKSIEYGFPNPSEAYYNLGGNYLMLGNVTKAREAWEQVLKYNPNHAETKKWLEQVAKMH